MKQEVETTSASNVTASSPSNATIAALTAVLVFLGVLLCYLVSTRFRL